MIETVSGMRFLSGMRLQSGMCLLSRCVSDAPDSVTDASAVRDFVRDAPEAFYIHR